MPTYDYHAKDEKRSCKYCRTGFEVRHGMMEKGPEKCPKCDREVVRAISAPQIKGDRWSEKRLLNKDNLRAKGFKTGADLLESGDVKI